MIFPFNLNATEEGYHLICIDTKTRRLTISFHFNEDNLEDTAVTVNSIESLSTNVNFIAKQIEGIDKNVKSGGANRDIYAQIAAGIRTRISYCTVFKVLFLVIFSIFQIRMITSVVKRVKVVKKIDLSKSDITSNTEFL